MPMLSKATVCVQTSSLSQAQTRRKCQSILPPGVFRRQPEVVRVSPPGAFWPMESMVYSKPLQAAGLRDFWQSSVVFVFPAVSIHCQISVFSSFQLYIPGITWAIIFEWYIHH